MKNLKTFFSNFLANSGQYLLLALLISKACSFLASVLVIRYLPQEQFGKIGIASAVFMAFSGASGLGNYQILLRYGSLLNSQHDKESLSSYLFQKGYISQAVISTLFFGAGFLFAKPGLEMATVFLFYSVRLFGVYFQNFIQSYLRISGQNRIFARSSNVINLVGLFLTTVLTYSFQFTGFLAAQALTPFLSLFWLKKEMVFSPQIRLAFSKKKMWNYGLHTVFTTTISDALFALDTVLLGLLVSETAVADYRVAIMIPVNLTFLAVAFLQADFPQLAANHQNRTFLKSYILNYYKVFIPLTVFIFCIGFYFAPKIIELFFGVKYLPVVPVFQVLLAAFLFSILSRNLYGNLLSAVGRMKSNTWISALSITSMLSVVYFAVPKYGISGTAAGLSAAIAGSGVLLAAEFYRYFRSLK